MPGTEIVRLYGQPEEQITVEVDPADLAELGLSVGQLAGRVGAADPKQPAGLLRSPRRDVPVEVDGAFEAIDRIRAIPLLDNGRGGVVRLGDIAVVERSWKRPMGERALAGGRESVFVAARMDRGRQVDRWAADADAVIDAFTATIGDGVVLETVFAQEAYTIDRLSDLAGNLLLGAAVVTLVVLGMMGWRSGLIVGLALPLVMSLTLAGILLTGGQLHQMAIFGMIIALGLLIDNAIVVVDETTKRLREGLSRPEAVAAAVRHLAAPLTASTLTTVLAFAPIVLLPGNAGDFVGYIGGSVILAILGSFAVSLTVIVALAGRFVRTDPDRRPTWLRDGVQLPRVSRLLQGGLRLGLSVPIATMLIAFAPALVGFSLAPTLGRQFFPPVDRDMFDLKLWLPQDAAITRTEQLVRRVHDALLEHEQIEGADWLIGASFPSVYYNLVMNRDNSPFFAQAAVTSAEATNRLIPELQAELDRRFPEAQLLVRQFGQGPPIDADVVFRLYGPDIGVLQDLGERVRRTLQAHPEVLHTRTSLPRGQPKLWLDASEDEAQLAGLSLADLADQLGAALEGVVRGSVLEQTEQLDVRVRFVDRHRRTPGSIASTNFVRLPNVEDGAVDWVPLAALGELNLRPELASITRFDGIRTNKIEGYTRDDALPIDVTRAVQADLDAAGFNLPPGYRLELGGSLEQDQEAVGNLFAFVPVLAALMVASLILATRSVRLCGVLLVVAVMSVGLALLSTWAIQFPISFNTILGTLGLIGVALNDSIVVLAAIRANPEARAGDPDAIVREVAGCTRHVFSTTLTTIGGFLPLLIFIGGEFWPSLAIVLVGGVGGATLLALLYIPAAYVCVVGRGAPRAMSNER